MTEEHFITQNEAKWKTLEAYNTRLVRGGMRKLPAEDIRAFAGLFRLASYHLAYAKTHYPGGQSLSYLNRLVGVAHNYFYTRESGGLADIKRYYLHGFPDAARRAARYFYIALALFMVGALFAGWYVAADTARFAQIYPGELSGLGGNGDGWNYPLMSAAIMTNNIRVAFSALAFGIFAGIGTAITLVYNGVIVGGLTGYMLQTGGDMITFLSLLLPHGVLELTAIFYSGACGLMIGRAVLIPGLHTRKHAVVKSAREAAALVPGIITMLVLAGLIEGFFTPLAIPAAVKLVFALMTLIGLLLYIPRLKR